MGTAFALEISHPTMKAANFTPQNKTYEIVPKLTLPLDSADLPQQPGEYTAGSNHAHYYSFIHKNSPVSTRPTHPTPQQAVELQVA